MPASKKTTAPTIDELIDNYEPALKEMVQALRSIIIKTDKEIAAQVKWNAPAFYYTGGMKAFNAKEYKRDLVVIHTQKGYPLLIFPTGAIIKDSSGLLEGVYADGRRMITITSMEMLQQKKKGTEKIIKAWLQAIEKE
ncbi:MAG: hypothetical protein RLZZ316_1287 [Bacteroidota bacterium]|jgi:hypothetical protein